jgi:hypothetical protein
MGEKRMKRNNGNDPGRRNLGKKEMVGFDLYTNNCVFNFKKVTVDPDDECNFCIGMYHAMRCDVKYDRGQC